MVSSLGWAEMGIADDALHSITISAQRRAIVGFRQYDVFSMYPPNYN
jgi:hypothetical protein